MTWAVYVAAVVFFQESKKIENSEMFGFIKENKDFFVKVMKD